MSLLLLFPLLLAGCDSTTPDDEDDDPGVPANGYVEIFVDGHSDQNDAYSVTMEAYWTETVADGVPHFTITLHDTVINPATDSVISTQTVILGGRLARPSDGTHPIESATDNTPGIITGMYMGFNSLQPYATIWSIEGTIAFTHNPPTNSLNGNFTYEGHTSSDGNPGEGPFYTVSGVFTAVGD